MVLSVLTTVGRCLERGGRGLVVSEPGSTTGGPGSKPTTSCGFLPLTSPVPTKDDRAMMILNGFLE